MIYNTFFFLFSLFCLRKSQPSISVTAIDGAVAAGRVVRFQLHGKSQNGENTLIGSLKLSYLCLCHHLPLTSQSHSLSLIELRKPFPFCFSVYNFHRYDSMCQKSRANSKNSVWYWNYDNPLHFGLSSLLCLITHSLLLSFFVFKLHILKIFYPILMIYVN